MAGAVECHREFDGAGDNRGGLRQRQPGCALGLKRNAGMGDCGQCNRQHACDPDNCL